MMAEVTEPRDHTDNNSESDSDVTINSDSVFAVSPASGSPSVLAISSDSGSDDDEVCNFHMFSYPHIMGGGGTYKYFTQIYSVYIIICHAVRLL